MLLPWEIVVQVLVVVVVFARQVFLVGQIVEFLRTVVVLVGAILVGRRLLLCVCCGTGVGAKLCCCCGVGGCCAINCGTTVELSESELRIRGPVVVDDTGTASDSDETAIALGEVSISTTSYVPCWFKDMRAGAATGPAIRRTVDGR